MTVRGPIPPEEMGPTLPHEHVLVDFVGAREASRDRYDADEVYRVALPHLRRIREQGIRTLVECTPAYLGRDPALLRRLSEASGLHILTPTGYYGAGRGKYLPDACPDRVGRRAGVALAARVAGGDRGDGHPARLHQARRRRRAAAGGQPQARAGGGRGPTWPAA